jgi:ferrochelatase
MRADGINKVVLMPLFPSYAATLGDFSSESWSAFRAGGTISHLERTWVTGSLSNIGFVKAIHDRIDQALQRFPVNLKSKIHVVFVARWSGTMSWRGNSSTPPEEVTRIVERITSDWQHDFSYSIGRVKSGFSKRTDPNSARAILRDIRESNTRAVLVVPIDHVSEQIDSAYRLDVVLRNVATEEGISHFKVASAVNCHPNFIQTLTEKISSQIEFEGLKTQSPDREALQSESGVSASNRQDEKYA